MKIVCCIKQVPDSSFDLKLDILGNVCLENNLLIVNPPDEHALEESLRIVERIGSGSVTAITVGSESAREVLATAISMGCTDAILLSDQAFLNAGTLGTAYILSQTIKKIGNVDIVLVGKISTDIQNGYTASSIAHYLNYNLLTNVRKIREIDTDDKAISVERLLEQGIQVANSKLPVVVSVTKNMNIPRRPSFIRKRQADQSEIPIWSARDIDVDCVKLKATVKRLNIYSPERIHNGCEMVAGKGLMETVAKLIDIITMENVRI